MAWFRRKDTESMDPQVLLAQSHEATPIEPISGAFRMTVQDVFAITGRGTVVVGRIEAGTVTTGATVRLTRADGSARDVRIAGIEAFRKRLDAASAGENVGLLLPEITRSDVASGDVLQAGP